jgi:lysyl-tRNA synthetase class 2
VKQLFDAKGMGIDVDATMGKGKLIDEIFELNAKETIFRLSLQIIQRKCHHCKQHRDNPELTERFELMVCGKEVANAYLN